MIVNLNLLAFTQVNARVPSLANGQGLARNSAARGPGVAGHVLVTFAPGGWKTAESR